MAGFWRRFVNIFLFCNSRSPCGLFVCTFCKDHDGPHAAHIDGGIVVESWPDDTQQKRKALVM